MEGADGPGGGPPGSGGGPPGSGRGPHGRPTSADRKAFAAHMSTPTSARTYCEICNHDFAGRPDNLKAHLRTNKHKVNAYRLGKAAELGDAGVLLGVRPRPESARPQYEAKRRRTEPAEGSEFHWMQHSTVDMPTLRSAVLSCRAQEHSSENAFWLAVANEYNARLPAGPLASPRADASTLHQAWEQESDKGQAAEGFMMFEEASPSSASPRTSLISGPAPRPDLPNMPIPQILLQGGPRSYIAPPRRLASRSMSSPDALPGYSTLPPPPPHDLLNPPMGMMPRMPALRIPVGTGGGTGEGGMQMDPSGTTLEQHISAVESRVEVALNLVKHLYRVTNTEIPANLSDVSWRT